MKRNLLNALVLAALATPSLAMAADAAPAPAVTANVGIVTNYLYRGISQTGAKPALQGGFDYAHASGLYAGVWGSSISWLSDAGVATNAGTEFDTYAGYKGEASGLGYDVGFLRYNYPGEYGTNTKADTNEIYGAATYSIVTAKLSYSLGDLFGTADAKGSTYMELNAAYPIADTGVSVGAHYGKQKFKGVNAVASAGPLTYSDYKLSATKDYSGYVLGLAYSNTNASAAYTVLNKKLGKGTAVLSLTHAM
jgi:uncharacterized protein (TIGR02001 family)